MEDGRRLPGLRPLVRRRGRRRRRRPAGPGRSAGRPDQARRRRLVAHPDLPLPAGRPRLRRDRPARRRPAVRGPGHVRPAGRRRRTRGGPASCSTWCPTTSPTSTRGSGRPSPTGRAPPRVRGSTSSPATRPPTRWQSMFGGPAWTRLPDGDWYLHLFAPEQPDLNWAHPDVRADAEETLRFWVARGVDGFRVDVAGGLAKDPRYAEIRRGTPVHPHWDRPEVHDVYRSWRRVLDEAAPDVYAVAEAWGPPDRTAAYARPDELGQAFTFDVFRTPWSAAAPASHDRRAAPAPTGPSTRCPRGSSATTTSPAQRTRLGPDRVARAAPVPAGHARRVLPLRRRRARPARRPPCRGRRGRTRSRCGPAAGSAQPRRRPGAAAVDLVGPVVRVHHRHAVAAHAPSLAEHARDVQEADPTSPWSVLALQRLRERSRLWVHAPTRVTWLPAPQGILVAQRGTSIAVLNASSRAWPLRRLVPTGHSVVATSTPHG